MAYRRILAVGDLHGNYQKFLSLWERLAFDPSQDLVVFLGDYTDRGAKSREVMAWVLAHIGKEHMVFLRGNHDEMMLAAMLGIDKELWLQNGGPETVKSLKGMEDLQGFLKQWAKAIQAMPLFYEIEQDGQAYWFMHAGLKPGVPLAEQDPQDLLWDRTIAFGEVAYDGDAVVTLGHTPVPLIHREHGEPMDDVPLILDGGRRILVDTGAFLQGCSLSAVDVLTKDIYQSDSMPELGGW